MELIKIFKKIDQQGKSYHSMPQGLRYIKEISEANIDYTKLHLFDAISIIYSLRIANADTYLKHKQQQLMQERGVSQVRQATAEDFNQL